MTPEQNRIVFFNELRNGGHKQNRFSLQDENGYCPLGVACVAVRNEVSLFRDGEGHLMGRSLLAQPPVKEALGFRSSSGAPIGDDARLDELMEFISEKAGIHPVLSIHDCNIIAMNDDLSLSFSDIADVLEKFTDLYFESDS